MAENVFSNPIFTEIVLPFILIFVLIFALLDRSKVLGEGKRQINAIVSLVIALIFISFSKAVGIVVDLMPFLAVLSVITLIFFILFGFVAADKEGLKIHKGIRIALGVIVTVALVVAILIVTGYWGKLKDLMTENVLTNVIFIVLIIGAMAVILTTGKKEKPGE